MYRRGEDLRHDFAVDYGRIEREGRRRLDVVRADGPGDVVDLVAWSQAMLERCRALRDMHPHRDFRPDPEPLVQWSHTARWLDAVLIGNHSDLRRVEPQEPTWVMSTMARFTTVD